MTRSRARSSTARKPSMALVAFASFSVLMAGSVGLSNGTETAPWQPAMAHDPQGPQRPAPSGHGTAADDAARPARPSLFASTPDHAAIESAKDASLVTLGRTASRADGDPGGHGAAGHGVSGHGTGGPGTSGSTVSPVTTAEHAPPIFKGELPVNTLIAPAQPVIVLKGGEFGWRTAPDTGQHELHNGTDISAPEGSPVVAALDGTVTAIFWDVWGGNRVEVSHANGMKTTYNHMSKVMVKVGDSLKASEQLGAVGHTGMRVTGPHLHFETWVKGQVVDAQSFDWKSGEDVIPASRPAYSVEDKAGTQQPPLAPGAKPGTDLGPAPAKAPERARDEIVALSRQTAPAKDTSKAGKASTGKTAERKGQASASGKDAKGSPSPSAGTKRPGGSAGKPVAGTPGKSTDKKRNTGSGNAGGGKGTPGTGSGTPGGPKGKPVTTPTTPPVKVPVTQPNPTPSKPAPGMPGPDKPVPTKPAPTKPAPTKPTPPVIDPVTAPITDLTTMTQLQQRTRATVGAHLSLKPEVQGKAYVKGSPLNMELQALVTRSAALKLSPTDPFIAQLTKAQQAVGAASAKSGDAKLAANANATAQLQELQRLVLAAPAVPGPAVPGPAVPGK
ncbi:M23 family metallopeptidase [Kocuria tytonis]|uniref:M23 family metallopeptidase n=1 Tax=Kocuria tytonis TaxID=2054280 RepID=A0A495A6K1_9MICC|nr:M23 family metallopeptidase [Kocuria tytonis]RKQ35344.1 M23 family metallopeptidase [Kocuria tytonis]